jgi:hypothetical protein
MPLSVELATIWKRELEVPGVAVGAGGGGVTPEAVGAGTAAVVGTVTGVAVGAGGGGVTPEAVGAGTAAVVGTVTGVAVGAGGGGALSMSLFEFFLLFLVLFFFPLPPLLPFLELWTDAAVGARTGALVGAVTGVAVGTVNGTAVGARTGAATGEAVGAGTGAVVGAATGEFFLLLLFPLPPLPSFLALLVDSSAKS